MGAKVHVVSSGELKGAGVPGSEVTDAHLDMFQDLIDGYAKIFKSSVAKARGFDNDHINLVSTGRTWLADEAKSLRLIDAVAAYDETKIFNTILKRKLAMTENEKQEIADKAKAEGKQEVMDKLNEMLAAFPDDPGFAVEAFKAGKTVADAQFEKEKANVEKMRAEVEAEKAELEAEKQAKLEAEKQAEAEAAKAAEEAKAEAEKAEAVQGADPVEHGEPAAEQKDDLVELGRKIAAEEKISIKDAMRKAYAMKKN